MRQITQKDYSDTLTLPEANVSYQAMKRRSARSPGSHDQRHEGKPVVQNDMARGSVNVQPRIVVGKEDGLPERIHQETGS